MTSPLAAAGADAEKLEGNLGDPVQPCPLKTGWIELSLTSGGAPCTGVRYHVTDRLHSEYEGLLDDQGFARVGPVDKRGCTVSFPEIDAHLDGHPPPADPDVYKGPMKLPSEQRHELKLPDWEAESLLAAPVAVAPAAQAAGEPAQPVEAQEAAAAAAEDDDWDLESLEAR